MTEQHELKTVKLRKETICASCGFPMKRLTRAYKGKLGLTCHSCVMDEHMDDEDALMLDDPYEFFGYSLEEPRIEW